MKEKTCCFIGHRDIPAAKRNKVRRELEREIGAALEDGYRTFITEFTEDADRLFVSCVTDCREQYADIFLEAIIPTSEHAKQYSVEAWNLLAKCGGIKVLCEECRQDYTLNILRYMAEQSSRAIALYDESAGDSLYALDYARTMELDLRIIKI